MQAETSNIEHRTLNIEVSATPDDPQVVPTFKRLCLKESRHGHH